MMLTRSGTWAVAVILLAIAAAYLTMIMVTL